MAATGTSTAMSIVLVHGGFVDGSGWAAVYKILKKDGYNVVVVQNPTLSLADDVAVTRRAIAAQRGAVLLVGHSYGGAVITEAGTIQKSLGSCTSPPSPRQGRISVVADQGFRRRRAGSSNPAAAGRLLVPRRGQVPLLLRGHVDVDTAAFHGKLPGAVGRRSTG